MTTMQTLPPLRHAFRDLFDLDTTTRAGVLMFFDALDGVPLDAHGAALFERFTGRPYIHRPQGYPQGVLQVGRQAGKSEGAAARLVYGAVGAVLAGKRGRVFLGVAQDHRAGMRALLGHVKRFADRPLVRPLVSKTTADAVEFEAGNVIYVYPCRPQAVRGLECDEVVLDEIAHYLSTEGYPRDLEMDRATAPTVANTAGKVLKLTSPHHAGGLLFDLHRRHFGNADSDVLYLVAPSTAFNRNLSEKFIAHLRDVDPESARAEIDAEFLSNVCTLFDPSALDAVVDGGVRQRPYQPGLSYQAFCDAASGTGRDAFTAAVAHTDAEHRAVLDALLMIRRPFSPESAVRQVTELLAEFHCADVYGDRYAPGFVTEAFNRHRIAYKPSDRDKSAIYLDLLPRVNAGAVRLLDNADLLRQLRGLERHRGATKDRVDHRRNAHDDAANSAAGALVRASTSRRRCATEIEYELG